MMKEEQPAEMNKLIRKVKRYNDLILFRYFRGDFDKVLKYIEQEEQLIKRFQGEIPEEIKVLHTNWLMYKANAYAYKGDLALSFKYANELLRVGQMYDHRRGISDGKFALGRYYWLSGDLEKALVHYDRAISLSERNLNDLWDFMQLANQLWMAMCASIDKEDLERAKKYFKRLEEIWELKPEGFPINDKIPETPNRDFSEMIIIFTFIK